MTSNQALKKAARAYAAEHGVPYTMALRTVRQSAAAPSEESRRRVVWRLQNGTLDSGVLPYPFYVLEDGTVCEQDFWRGEPARLIGFAADPATQTIDLYRHQWVSGDRQGVVGMYPVMRAADRDYPQVEHGGMALYRGAITSVKQVELPALAPVTATFHLKDEFAATYPATLPKSFTFDVAEWIGHLHDRTIHEARAEGWRHPGLSAFLYAARWFFEDHPGPQRGTHPAIAAARWAEDQTVEAWDETVGDEGADVVTEAFEISLDPDEVEMFLATQHQSLGRVALPPVQARVEALGEGGGVVTAHWVLPVGVLGSLDVESLLALRWAGWSATVDPARAGLADGSISEEVGLNTVAQSIVDAYRARHRDGVSPGMVAALDRSHDVREFTVSLEVDEAENWFADWMRGHGLVGWVGRQDLSRRTIELLNRTDRDLGAFASGVFWAAYSLPFLRRGDEYGTPGQMTPRLRDALADSGIAAVLQPPLTYEEAWDEVLSTRAGLSGQALNMLADLLDRASAVDEGR